MAWLGVRCWKDKVAMVAVNDAAPAEVVFRRRQPCPATDDPGKRAAWFAKVVTEALDETGCQGVSVRVADSDPDQLRAEADGAVLAAATAAGVATKTLRRQSMMKPLGVPGGPGAWATFQKKDDFIGTLVGDEKDAAMASLAAARQ